MVVPMRIRTILITTVIIILEILVIVIIIVVRFACETSAAAHTQVFVVAVRGRRTRTRLRFRSGALNKDATEEVGYEGSPSLRSPSVRDPCCCPRRRSLWQDERTWFSGPLIRYYRNIFCLMYVTIAERLPIANGKVAVDSALALRAHKTSAVPIFVQRLNARAFDFFLTAATQDRCLGSRSRRWRRGRGRSDFLRRWRRGRGRNF